MPPLSVEEARLIASKRVEKYPRLHLALHQHRNARDVMLNFSNRYWLIDIYKDHSDKIVIQKASKVGVSEWLFVDLFILAQMGKNGMYILPTQPIRNRLVSSRIDPIISRVPFYYENIAAAKKEVHAKSLKTIFGTAWNFVGSNSPEDFYEFDADVLMYDEFDKCNQANLALAADRTGSAEKEMWRKIGNPSIAGIGIDDEFENSDQKYWHIKCEHCGEWQTLDWFVNFVIDEGGGKYLLKDNTREINAGSRGNEDARAMCRRCNAFLDRLADGEWIAKYPDRDVSGYQVSRLFGAPGNDNLIEPRMIIREEFDIWVKAQGNPTLLQIFYNNRLGIPYEGAGAKITESILSSCCEEEYLMPAKAKGTICGVDIGSQLHVHISEIERGVRKKVFIGVLADYEELNRVCNLYGVVTGVMDAGPEIHEPRKFIRNHPGWYLCRYNLSEKLKQSENKGYSDMVIDHVAQAISVNRTESLDSSYETYLNNKVILPRDWRFINKGEFLKQMIMPTRIKEERPDKSFRYVWTKGKDHHRHADNYELIANKIYGGSGSAVTVL